MRWAGLHAYERAKERYGVRATDGDFRYMVYKILASICYNEPGASFVGTNGEREVWDVEIGSHVVRAVYEPSSASIISVLDNPRSNGKACRTNPREST